MSRLHHRLDQARRSATTQDEFRAVIDDTMHDIQSVVETFEALLNIAQIEAGARKSRFRKVDLSRLITDISEIYEPVAEDSGDTLIIENAPIAPAYVQGDKELLTQLLANLVENSIRHCPPGTRIALGLASAPENKLCLSVADDGPGIPQEERTNVLKRFYRLERERLSPGNGLGLSMATAIADLHDASLSFEGDGPGLRVAITIPRAGA